MSRLLVLFIFIIVTSFWITACFNEEFTPAQSIDITTSQDSLLFDTVFTTIGSATRYIKIFNHSTENVILSSVTLAKGAESMFRINVDGIQGPQVSDIPILAEDSIYVFVEVTVDPDAPLGVSPFVISELLYIETQGAKLQVTLEAWGQNANYFPSKNARGQLIGLSCDGEQLIWDDPKPYVVYGLLFVDSCDLVLAPGTQVHFHGGLGRIEDVIFNDGGLLFQEHGRLIAQGTLDQPIVMQGDRLESNFDSQSGQWAGIRFLAQSHDNILHHVTIKNSVVGVRVDSAATLDIESCQIYNTAQIGIIGINADMSIRNSLLHSNAAQGVAFVSGGNYTITHTTIANFGNKPTAIYMDNYTCLDQECESIEVNPLTVKIDNSIIVGNDSDEFDIKDITEGSDEEAFQLDINNTVVRVHEIKEIFDWQNYVNGIVEWNSTDPLFVDISGNEYQLDSLSVALGVAQYIESLPTDIIGNQRDPQMPDAGCYESQE